MKKQTVSETFRQACRLRPPLRPILEAFEPLYAKRQAIAETIAPTLDDSAIAEIAQSGAYPLLRKHPPARLAQHIRAAARELLPELAKQDAISPFSENLDRLFTSTDAEQDQEKLGQAYLSEDMDQINAIAMQYGVDPGIIVFASDFIISAVLRAFALRLAFDDFPDWRKNTCPVCGFPPVMAWLGRRPPIGDNEFLVSGGGKKRLHCGICGADWHFVRGICPACGTQGQDAMQILGEESRRHERIDWCEKCNAYLPLIDLREMADTPDMDAMALSLMHLDLVAAQRGLLPLKPSFWNRY